MKRFLLWSTGVIAALVVGLLGYVEIRQNRTFDAPEPPLHATDDSTVIARGRYLAFGPAHCAACHGPADVIEKVMGDPKSTARYLDEQPPLSGGFTYPLPFGTLHFPNITPDSATGIGRFTDGQIARVLRYGVKPDGQALLPVMEYQNISDADIVALLSFLRAQRPVHKAVPAHQFNLMGKALKALVFRPLGPTGTPPATSPPQEATVERGEYLANRVAQCAQCHTRRNMLDLSFEGPRLSGGAVLNEPNAPDVTFVTPNLTPDPETGWITGWSEEQFVARFHAGRAVKESPMPWEFFQRMTDTDLRAIYRYLRSLKPVHNATGPTVRPHDTKGG